MPEFDDIYSENDKPANDCPSTEINPSITPNEDNAQETYTTEYYSPYDAPQYQKPVSQPSMPRPFQSPNQQMPIPSNINYSYCQKQPYYMPPYYPPMALPRQAGEGTAIASLVLGILSIFLVCVPFINILLSLLALIFGIVAKTKGNRGVAIAGMVLGLIGIILSILILILIFTSIFTSINSFDSGFAEDWNNYTALIYLH